MQDFIDAFKFIPDNAQLLLDKTVEHLELSFAAIGIALLIALPIGILLGHWHRGSFVAINVSNIGRALPSLAVIALGLAVFGIGFTNVMFALIILAVPPILTNAYVAIDGVDRDAVEAARGMGMNGRQLLTRVEMPLALPLIFTGIRTAVVYVIATATLAAIAGGGGLGEIIVNQASYRLAGVLGAAIVVTVLAVGADVVLAFIQRLITPEPLRETRRGRAMAAATRGQA
jgi:osmoprotectant transport system permease protein